MFARLAFLALLLAFSHYATAQNESTTAEAKHKLASEQASESPSAWAALMRAFGIALPNSALAPLAEPQAQTPEAQLAERRAQLSALAERNRRQAKQLDALSLAVREREAELARRTAEQAELAERLDRLESLMNRNND